MTTTEDRRETRERTDVPHVREGAADTHPGRQDWSTWPLYDAAAKGFRENWYPVLWTKALRDGKPQQVELLGEKIMVMRDGGEIYALHDRCVHRGVPLSQGTRQFPGTVSCAYHGWTFSLEDGNLAAVITDGPDSPICGKAQVRTYPTAQRLGMLWIYVGEREPFPADDALPEELRGATLVMGGRIDERDGNWRLAAENGYDEGHAKYLHRTSLWRLFKAMPTWNITSITREGNWIYRTQDEVHWDAEFPGLGRWTNKRWWKINPPDTKDFSLGNTGAGKTPDPEIEQLGFPGFVSIAYPGILRVAYPTFVHYEYYVPIDEHRHRYVGFMIRFKSGLAAKLWKLKYLFQIRPFFHGNFSNQDKWMVEQTDAPPEKLYRPDRSLIMWRMLANEKAKEQGLPFEEVPDRTFERIAPAGTGGSEPASQDDVA